MSTELSVLADLVEKGVQTEYLMLSLKSGRVADCIERQSIGEQAQRHRILNVLRTSNPPLARRVGRLSVRRKNTSREGQPSDLSRWIEARKDEYDSRSQNPNSWPVGADEG